MIKYIVILLVLISIPTLAHAKFDKQFETDFEARYIPAIPHLGLVTAARVPEENKIKTYVVIKKGGLIPADRAEYYITPGKYDYIGAIVENGVLKKRRGSRPTLYLHEGTVMILSDVVFSGDIVYLKLLSVLKQPSEKHPRKKQTRVAVMLGFKLAKEVIQNREMVKVFDLIGEWVTPYATLEEATSGVTASETKQSK